jgi:putative transposon-encoded protein
MDLAMMNFSWAMDLDPKGANNQIKEAIDKRYATDDDDTVTHLGDPGKILMPPRITGKRAETISWVL